MRKPFFGWLVITSLVNLPFPLPAPAILAKQISTPSTFLLTLDTSNGLGVLSVNSQPPFKSFKPGDSNETIKQNQIDADLAAKAAEVARVVQQNLARKNVYKVASGIRYNSDIQILDTGKAEYFNCVAYVRSQRFMPRTLNGNAGTTPINTETPIIGAVAVMAGHVGLVSAIGDTFVTITDANYISGALTRHNVPTTAIRGYWN